MVTDNGSKKNDQSTNEPINKGENELAELFVAILKKLDEKWQKRFMVFVAVVVGILAKESVVDILQEVGKIFDNITGKASTATAKAKEYAQYLAKRVSKVLEQGWKVIVQNFAWAIMWPALILVTVWLTPLYLTFSWLLAFVIILVAMWSTQVAWGFKSSLWPKRLVRLVLSVVFISLLLALIPAGMWTATIGTPGPFGWLNQRFTPSQVQQEARITDAAWKNLEQARGIIRAQKIRDDIIATGGKNISADDIKFFKQEAVGLLGFAKDGVEGLVKRAFNSEGKEKKKSPAEPRAVWTTFTITGEKALDTVRLDLSKAPVVTFHVKKGKVREMRQDPSSDQWHHVKWLLPGLQSYPVNSAGIWHLATAKGKTAEIEIYYPIFQLEILPVSVPVTVASLPLANGVKIDPVKVMEELERLNKEKPPQDLNNGPKNGVLFRIGQAILLLGSVLILLYLLLMFLGAFLLVTVGTVWGVSFFLRQFNVRENGAEEEANAHRQAEEEAEARQQVRQQAEEEEEEAVRRQGEEEEKEDTRRQAEEEAEARQQICRQAEEEAEAEERDEAMSCTLFQ